MKRRGFTRLALLLVLAGAIGSALAYWENLAPAALEAQVRSYGLWAPAAFVAVYTLATVLFLPGSVFALAGGALFGPMWGAVYNLTAATTGATLAFVVARYLASDWVANKSGGRLKQLIDGVEAEGWRFVAFVRLAPLFPFNLLNYALGLTRIRLSHYVIASLLCMIPGGLAYTYLGYAGREAAAGSEGFIRQGLIALGLLAAVVFLPRLIRRFRRPDMLSVADLKTRLDRDEDVLLLDVRGADEFHGPLGHLPGAINVALGDLPGRLAEIEGDRGRPVVIVCRTDRRSAKAAQILRDADLGRVAVLRGGMEQWNRISRPVEGPESPGLCGTEATEGAGDDE